MLHLVPGETQCIYAEKGSKQASLQGPEEQYGLTSCLAVTVQG